MKNTRLNYGKIVRNKFRQNLSFFVGKFSSVFIFLLVLLTVSASAATYQVTNTADSGAGSLRQAVSDANGTATNDTINFNIPPANPNCDANRICTITLTGGVIAIQAAGGALTISNQTGAGKLMISGNNSNRIFECGENANLTLNGLTVTRGVGSGSLGVVSNFRGTLTITNSVFSQNSGEYVIYNSAFGTSGVLNVSNTTINNNAAIGIFATNLLTNGGTVNIVNSTVSNNAAAGGGNGGGIYFLGERLTITNSTISGNRNSQGGGIFVTVTPGSASVSSIILTNCTVTANAATQGGGGIHVFQATIKLRNTIVAGNTSSVGTPDFNFQLGSATSLGNNLIGDATNTGSSNGLWLASDNLNRDARLEPLADNGGQTQTHALLPDSPAVNAGNNCVLTANGCGDNNPAIPTDQRGAIRVGNVDIGAYELAARTKFDFDGDGKSDISVFRPDNGVWYLNQSANGFTGLQFGIAADKIVPADYDGDGKTDLAVYRSGVWYLNRSSSGFTGISFGDSNDIPQPADFDGDGKAELAVWRPSNGTWYVYNLATNQVAAAQFGAPTDKPVASDYNGDGKADFAVFRPSNGTWYIAKPTGTPSQNFDSIKFGESADKPVPADYDGDDKTDIAVFRPSNGTWYLLQSTNGFTGVQFGIPTDLPAAADYDGDGKADVSVFRNGIWYRLNSSNGAFYAEQFGTATDKPIQNAFVQ
ncbi:MAG: FG-GAP-like repeat-containing protein [Acidobacteriota bacterium]